MLELGHVHKQCASVQHGKSRLGKQRHVHADRLRGVLCCTGWRQVAVVLAVAAAMTMGATPEQVIAWNNRTSKSRRANN